MSEDLALPDPHELASWVNQFVGYHTTFTQDPLRLFLRECCASRSFSRTAGAIYCTAQS